MPSFPVKVEHVFLSLTPREVSLIVALRERYRYGVVSLLMRDGIIMRLVSAEKFENVGIDSETLPELIRETSDGEITITVKNGKPYRLKETVSFDFL